MSAMLLFTAIGHFVFTKGMTMMVPDFVPFKKAMVYFTGLLEVFFAITLQVSSLINYTAWALIIFFIFLLPSNIKAAMQHIDYQKADNDGPGPQYLWFRVPLQLFFIGWIYVFARGFSI